MTVWDYSKLIGKIVEVYRKREAFATDMNISAPTLTSRLKSRSSFTQREIKRAVELLGIPYDEIPIYFFTEKV